MFEDGCDLRQFEAPELTEHALCCRLAALVKDYCGSLSEKSVQMNFALIYELLDEIVVSLCAAPPFGYRWCCKVLLYVKKDVASNLHSYRPEEDSGLTVKMNVSHFFCDLC